jgi:hypothetical protein
LELSWSEPGVDSRDRRRVSPPWRTTEHSSISSSSSNLTRVGLADSVEAVALPLAAAAAVVPREILWRFDDGASDDSFEAAADFLARPFLEDDGSCCVAVNDDDEEEEEVEAEGVLSISS